ncbi:MAG: polysaccharide biosynthesis/export family protein, partial [Acinetobacter sp.]
IGPGDEIHVQLYGKDNAVHDLKVGREGYIDFPDLGPISATGLTFQQFRKDLEARIKEQMIGVNVFISFGSMRAMQVFVMGDAYRPGAYNVSGMATVTQVLQAAGGIDTVGSLRKIQVKRAGQKVIDVDLYKMLVWGDTSQDIRLQAGDTVFVPAKGSEVAINGLVKRPAIYELRSTASLAEVLALAGGVKAAALQEVSIERHTDTGLRVFNLTLANAHDRSFSIRDGDKISIKPSSTEYSQAIVVKGAVVRDGVYSFSPGTRVSSILKSEQRDLISATDLSYALVVREMDSQRNISVIQFNLGHALRNPGGKDDLLLQARDQVLIFRNDATDRIKETANIYSAVKDITAKSQELNNAAMMNIDASTGANVKNNELDTDNQIKLSSLSDKTATDAVVTDSRQALLAPVIERLKAQSTLGQPVKIMEVRGE